MFDLTNKVAVVTGSSRGIGATIATTLAARGAKVVVNHRNSAEGAARVVEEIKAAGGEAIVSQADVSSSAEAQKLIKETIDTYGQIDILVNNAGTTRDTLIMTMKDEDWALTRSPAIEPSSCSDFMTFPPFPVPLIGPLRHCNTRLTRNQKHLAVGHLALVFFDSFPRILQKVSYPNVGLER